MRTSDSYLIHKCLNGDKEAFGLLVERYKEGVYALAYARLQHAQDAQDITQEVFLRAYRKLASLRSWDSFHAWLYRITHSLCMNWLRTKSRQPEEESLDSQAKSNLALSMMRYHQEDQLRQSVRDAIAALPEPHREVLMLHYLGGMSLREIAEALSVKPNAVGQRLSRARQRLKQEMLDMMDTAFEDVRLQPGFTLRVLDLTKRVKIQPIPQGQVLPWSISVMAGVALTLLLFGTPWITPSPVGQLVGSALPSTTQQVSMGEIAVTLMPTSAIMLPGSTQGEADVGQKQAPQQAFAPPGQGGEWTRRADMPTAREGVRTAVVDGKIYAFGGFVGEWLGDAVPTVEVYDPRTNTWEKRADMPTPRARPSAHVIDGKVYVIGGYAGHIQRSLDVTEVYDPRTDSWAKGAPMPTARGSHGAAVVDGKIYVVGGAKVGGNIVYYTNLEIYDPRADSWESKASMKTLRGDLTFDAVGDTLYAIGGWKGRCLSTIEAYDIATDTWSTKADSPTAICGQATCVVDGQIWFIGGLEAQGQFTTATQIYDPLTETWEQRPPIPTPRFGLSASIVDGKIYTIGGIADDVNLSTVEVFTPEGWVTQSVSPHGKRRTTWGGQKAF